jgi:hypothetical protein
LSLLANSRHQHAPDDGLAKRLAVFDGPLVVRMAGGHGGAPAAPCALTDSEALPEFPVDLLVVDVVLDPPIDPDAPDTLGSVAVGTLRGSQPKSIEHVGFAGLVKKPGFCCVA